MDLSVRWCVLVGGELDGGEIDGLIDGGKSYAIPTPAEGTRME